MKRFLKILLLIPLGFLLVNVGFASSNVLITLLPDHTDLVPNEEFSSILSIKSESLINVSTFRLKIKFDSKKLLYQGLYSSYYTSDFKSNIINDEITIIYLTSEKGINIEPNKISDILEINFKVLSDVSIGDISMSATIDGVGNYGAEEIPSPNIEDFKASIVKQGEADCNLTYLKAVDCTLKPSFSPDITRYTVDVPYSKNTIEFKATSSDENATIKVSRKTLNSAGKSTEIKITVISPDGKSKKAYTVVVNRSNKGSTSSLSKSSSNQNSSSSSEYTNSSDEEYTLNSPNSSSLVSSNNAKKSDSLIINQGNSNIILIVSVVVIFIFAAYFILKLGRNKKR